jgi:acyl-lipid omega-6 desaturase (Delta-12 desaturase)
MRLLYFAIVLIYNVFINPIRLIARDLCGNAHPHEYQGVIVAVANRSIQAEENQLDSTLPVAQPRKTGKPAWVSVVAKYQHPITSTSLWQIANSFGPYVLLWVLMYISLRYSYWITLALSALAGAFLMRVFIIQHDCGHNSFFKSRRLNDLTGFICGIFTMTPYEHWRTGHAMHHATSGDLDNRGFGDVQTMTVKEYIAASPLDRFKYRMYRHPLVMFGFGPLYVFIINQRSPIALRSAPTKKAARGLILTDLTLIGLVVGMSLLIGFQNYILIQLPTAIFAATLGVWLFYVQHNFEDTYWRAHPEWDYTQAALEGSSYYKLPKIFQWFTGNIGLHHIHHLSPRIPNYLLEKCHEENPAFQEVPTLTLKSSFKILWSRLALWDEEQRKLISFKETHERYLTAQPAVTQPEVG